MYAGGNSGVLELKGLTKYFGGLAALNRFDLKVGHGEIIGIIGPNGAGKTTLFNLITGFLRLTKGELVFEGMDITGKKPHFVAERGIVRTFQATSLFPDFTVFKNIVAACHQVPKAGFWESLFHTPGYRRKEKTARERALDLSHFFGLDKVAHLPARSLPHGHKRILGMAIALAADPKLLLLDEPLCGMSAEEVDWARALIRRIWERGLTILLIEHNMRAVMDLCQRIVVLNFGQKIAEGAPEEIKKNRDVIEAYLGAGEYAAPGK